MTISSETRRAGPFIGNGSTTALPFTFKVFEAADLLVVTVDTTTDVETTLVLNSDYTVTLNGNQDANPGGTVNLASPLAVGTNAVVTSSMKHLQSTLITNQGGFYPRVINDSLDRVTILTQQLREALDRSVRVAVSSDLPGPTLPNPIANKIVGWNAAGDDLALFDWESPAWFSGQRAAAENAAIQAGNYAADSSNFADSSAASAQTAADLRNLIGSLVAGATPTVVRFSGDGVTTDFNLPVTPGAEENTQVFVGGSYQQKDTYSVTGTTLSFASAPANGSDNIEVVIGPSVQLAIASALAMMFTQAGSGAVARTAQDKLRDIVSVKDFGAVGDGVTDDTTKIQNAIDSLAATGGKVVFPPGVYRVTSTITIAGPVDIAGATSSGNMSNTGANTRGAEILVDGATWGITVDCATSSQDGPSLKNLRLKDGGSALGGVYVKRGIGTVLDTVRCKDFPIGVQVGSSGNDLYWVRLKNCSMWFCAVAYKLTGDYCGSVTIEGGGNLGPGSGVANSMGVLYDASNGAPIWMHGCTFDAFETGARFSGNSANAVVTARFEACVTGVDIRARNIKVIGSYFSNLTDAISFANSTQSATERAYIAGNDYRAVSGAYIKFPAGYNRNSVAILDAFPAESIGRLAIADFYHGIAHVGNLGPGLDSVVAGGGSTLGSPTGMLGFNLKTSFPGGTTFDLNTTGGNNAGAAIISGGGVLDFYTVPSGGSASRTIDQATLLTHRRGRIGSNGNWLIGTASDNTAGRLQVAGVVAPDSDNVRDLGTASYRWRTLYAGTGTINTSDAREKTDIAPLTPSEMEAAKALAREIGTFQWLASVAEKGQAAARHHVGLTVQRAIEIMEQHGLDPMRYGFICYDQWNEGRDDEGAVMRHAGDRFAFRPDQLNLFIARGLEARMTALEEALAGS